MSLMEARDLTKSYGEKTVVDGLTFRVGERECLGLLGPNGAGKTTLLRLLYGNLLPDVGDVSILGMSSRQNALRIRGVIGVVPQDDGLDPDFSVYDNLWLYGRYQKLSGRALVSRIDQALDKLRLGEHRDHRIDQLSGGLKRRVTLARALLHQPKMILLDEPTTGLDPAAREILWPIVQELKASGVGLILTTHYMDEAEVLCDRILLMDRGRILSEGSPKRLIQEQVGVEVLELHFEEHDREYLLNRIPKSIEHRLMRNAAHLFLKHSGQAQELIGHFVGRRATVRPATLGDVFLKVSGTDLMNQGVE